MVFRARWQMIWGGFVCGLLAVLVANTTAIAATEAHVSIGFNGRVVDGALTPIRVQVEHEGLAINGRLVVSQTVNTPWRGVLTETLAQPLSLGQRSSKSLTVYFPINSIVYPVSVWLENGSGEPLFHTELDLREVGQTTPLTLALSESGFPQMLPTQETITKIAPAELPDRIEGLESVARLYLGRFNLSTLSQSQQDALLRWVMAGGELVLFTGDNWYVQASHVLEPWLPLQPKSVEQMTLLNGTTFSMVVGQSQGVVLYPLNRHPALVHKPLGLGDIYMVTVDPLVLDETVPTFRLWELLTPNLSEASLTNAFGQQAETLFRRHELSFPDRFFLAAVLLVFAGGAGLLMWASMRRPWAGAALLGWVLVASVGFSVLMQQPQYARPLTTIEFGVEMSLPDGASIQRLWYGLYSQRGEEAQLLLPEATQLRQRIPQERGEHLFDVTYDHTAESAVWLRTQPQQIRSFSGSAVRPAGFAWRWLSNNETLEVFSPLGLERAWLLHRGRLLDLGSLQAEQSKQFNLGRLREISSERDLPRPIAHFWSWSLELYNTGTLMGGWHQSSAVHPAGRTTQQSFHLMVAEAL